MTRPFQLMLCLLVAAAISVGAQNAIPPRAGHAPAAGKSVPPVPSLQSPISFFRKLLAMSSAERENSLTNRSPEARERILAKVEEYEILPSPEREVRLRATELRWWLMPMLTNSPADRERRLAQAPEDLRPLIKSRLEQWSILPPSLQEEYLSNEQAMKYMTLMPTPPLPDVAERQQKIAEAFNRFFELTAEEKEQALTALSDDEKAQMAETLKTFNNLPPEKRQLCVENYAKFAGLSASEQAEFLKNAERWSQMSPEERQSWRELVQQVPIWPAGWTPQQMPPLPPGAARVPSPGVATN